MGSRADRCCKTFTPSGNFIVIPSLEEQPIKAIEIPSPHAVGPTPLDTNPVFQCLGENSLNWNGNPIQSF